jgi:hemerythrin-like domain-containing protein
MYLTNPGIAKDGTAVTEQTPPAIGRRHLLASCTSIAGALAVSGCGKPLSKPGPDASGAPAEEGAPVTPPEDLMREHGVLKRVLLIYREGIGQLQAGEQTPMHALNSGAGIIRRFIEDYHEKLEEQYVFPRLEKAGKLTDLTGVLRTQHQRGRLLTDRVLSATSGSAASDQPARDALAQDLLTFIRMYEPHEAREDTVIFPALRGVVTVGEFRDMAETFEDEEHRRFGQDGFQRVVDEVANIEKSLGIYDLSKFTPA